MKDGHTNFVGNMRLTERTSDSYNSPHCLTHNHQHYLFLFVCLFCCLLFCLGITLLVCFSFLPSAYTVMHNCTVLIDLFYIYSCNFKKHTHNSSESNMVAEMVNMNRHGRFTISCENLFKRGLTKEEFCLIFLDLWGMGRGK